MDAVASASIDEIGSVRGVGPIIAEGVVKFFKDPGARRLLEKLRKAGVNFTEPRKVVAGGALAGKTVVITGTLPTLTRPKATEAVEKAGGRVTSSVSKSTSFLVAGEEAGSKLDKAQKLGVKIITEAELLNILEKS
jgi:DNA ligase (NAD+)